MVYNHHKTHKNMIFQYHYTDTEVKEYFERFGFEVTEGSEERPVFSTHSKDDYHTVAVPVVSYAGKEHNAQRLFDDVLRKRISAFATSKPFNDKETINQLLNK
jgi:hypothetical protein